MKGEARLGRLRCACGAADEDDAEQSFERRERPADRLQRATKASRGPGQIPGLDDRDEGLVVAELGAGGGEFFHFLGEYRRCLRYPSGRPRSQRRLQRISSIL